MTDSVTNGSLSEILDSDQHRYVSRKMWAFAALGAFAIHAACVAVALGSLSSADEADLGAPAIEIGVELMSPRRDPVNLPVGPDTVASANAPAVVEQKAIINRTDLPKALPTETDDPEQLVTPDDRKKTKHDDPKLATTQAEPSEQSIAARDTVMPSVKW